MTPLTRNASAFALLVATFIARWPFRGVPLIRDEGEIAHLAQGLRSGIVPYLEIYNQKPPVAFSLISAVQALAGESIEALRLATTLWFLLGGAGLFVTVRRWLDDRAALLALASYCLLGVGQAGLFHQASTEVFALPWLVLGIAAWLQARTGFDSDSGLAAGRRAALLAGVAAALAYQTKQTSIALAAAIALDTLLFGRSRAAWIIAGWAGLGFAALTAAVLTALAAAGALGAYVDSTWLHNWSYVGARHGGGLLPLSIPVANFDAPLWCAGALGLIVLALRSDQRPLRVVALLGATTFATALFAGHAYAHYYVPLIVPLSIGFGAIAVEFGRRTPRVVAIVVVGGVIASPLGLALVHGTRPQLAIQRVLDQAPNVAASRDVAEYLAARTLPDEAIGVIGSEPQVYFLADRPSVLRMAILYPASGGYPHSDRLLAEFESRLRSAPTRYLAIAENWRSFAESRPAGRRLRQRLASILEKDYEPDRDFPGAFRVLRRRAPHLLLLITTDTLRADHIGAYGSTTSRTPVIDALARDSLRFTSSFAPAPYTMPSVASLLTGRYPEELGILANRALFRGTNLTLAGFLRKDGWHTGAVVSNYVLRRGTGIEAGFELYDDAFSTSETNRDQPERNARDTTDAALSALDRLRETPDDSIFLWVHYQDPHGPYLPPGDSRAAHLATALSTENGKLELPVRGMNPLGAIPSYQFVDGRHDVGFYLAGYAGEVEFVDAEIGRLLDGVGKRIAEVETTVVFTADHGESLGEDDYWFAHGAFLSDALVRVPLLIRSPSLAPGVREDIASLVDLVPTLLERFGAERPSTLAGRDLLAPDAEQMPGRAYLANLMGARDKRWGWVEDGHVFVHERPDSGEELAELRSLASGESRDDPERLVRMRAALETFRSNLRVQSEVQQLLSPRDLEMLKRLGYVE